MMQNKDAGYVENQQQNISDAIDLLPRLATGIDVNIQYRRVDDFEFTPECAIFDLLDIPLYHGWIVDPQDYDTSNAIGSKSYNTLTGELVALETRNTEGEHKSNPEEDFIDFAAATTATLGVPCPSLSKNRSFDESPLPISDLQKGKKGDVEEEEVLLRVLKLSTSVDESLSVDTNGGNTPVSSDESTLLKSSVPKVLVDTIEGHIDGDHQIFRQPEPILLQDHNASSSYNNDSETIPREADCSSSKIDGGNHIDQSSFEKSGEPFICHDMMENTRNDALVQNQSAPFVFPDRDLYSAYQDHIHGLGEDQQVQQTYPQSTSTSEIHLEPADNQISCNTTVFSGSSVLNANSDSSSDRRQHIDVPEAVTSSLDGSEPIYEGEECILDSGLTIYESGEPVYEGEMVLAEQAERGAEDACDVGLGPKDEITFQKGELIRNFLKNNASQLTIYGLFCLREGLKERELCVFFRNNHFSTMFKFNGELYLLATDQGYINQPDLVWEKLNEVNGDTVFMTGNFKEFKVENHANDTWDEQNAVANTADYLASIDNSAPTGSTLNSDLQLAIALQQQEFEHQPQRHNLKESSNSGSSRLVTGPQVNAFYVTLSNKSSKSSSHILLPAAGAEEQ
ncbi:hypothetical protein HHK36_027865 [Tetracentron sinense]|uniref:MINDY deubiquitinase domain-containing protein n=1 Tax=Tetracentron sinense TaxID=13715 RepID=A0A835D1Y1_TETSI|nr:hypothetical protein HHK36_027865 [Tetracentron sinense]